MTQISRKAFLRLTAAAAATAAVATRTSASAATPAAAPKGPARPTLIKGADLLTMDPTLKEAMATDILLKDGKIAAIGKNLAVQDAEVIEAAGMIVMPGMSDGHRHVWQIIGQGQVTKFQPTSYAKYQEWKSKMMVSLTPEDNYLAGYLGGVLAIDSGVTSILDYAHGQHNQEKALANARGIQASGIAGWYGFQLGVSSSFKPGETVPLASAASERVANARPEHWATAEALQKDVFSDSSAVMQLSVSPTQGNGDKIEDIRAEFERIRGMGVKLICAHNHRPSKPAPAGHMGHRDSGIPDLLEAKLLGPDFHISHGNRLTNDELKMMADTGTMLCATAMGETVYIANPNRGAPSHGRARSLGVAVGIGIDVAAALPGDYFEHVRAAFWTLYQEPESRALAQKYVSSDSLDFATALGAKALKLGDVTGTLTVGKRADVLLIRTDRLDFASEGSLSDRVVTFASTKDIDSVWIAGKAMKRNGQMVGVDMKKLKADMMAAQKRFRPLAESITFTT